MVLLFTKHPFKAHGLILSGSNSRMYYVSVTEVVRDVVTEVQETTRLAILL